MDGYQGFRAWKWMFIIEGVVTIGVAFGAYFILPDFPRTTSWLTEEEQQLAAWRLEEDVGEDDRADSEQQTFWHGAKLAFLDVKTYVLVRAHLHSSLHRSPLCSSSLQSNADTKHPPPKTIMLFCIVSSGSVTNFFPTVVRTLGYNDIITLLLTAPPYVLAVFVTLINAWHADKTGERYLHVTLPLCVAMAAYILAASTSSLTPRYISMMLMVSPI